MARLPVSATQNSAACLGPKSNSLSFSHGSPRAAPIATRRWEGSAWATFPENSSDPGASEFEIDSERNVTVFVLAERVVLFGRLRWLGRIFTLRLGTVAVARWGKDLHVLGNDVV